MKKVLLTQTCFFLAVAGCNGPTSIDGPTYLPKGLIIEAAFDRNPAEVNTTVAMNVTVTRDIEEAPRHSLNVTLLLPASIDAIGNASTHGYVHEQGDSLAHTFHIRPYEPGNFPITVKATLANEEDWEWTLTDNFTLLVRTETS